MVWPVVGMPQLIWAHADGGVPATIASKTAETGSGRVEATDSS